MAGTVVRCAATHNNKATKSALHFVTGEGAKQQAGAAGAEDSQQPAATQPPEQPATLAQAAAAGVEEDDDEDDSKETCGFCKFMKGGGCRNAFIAWSKCVDRERDAKSDFTAECHKQTMMLRECMMAHKDYYAPLLEEEEAMMREQEDGQVQQGQAEEGQQREQQQQQREQHAEAAAVQS